MLRSGGADGAGRVDRTQHVLRGGALLGVELEVELLAATDQAVHALLQADAVLLEPVAQPRLGDAPAVLQLVHQVEDLVVEVLGEVGREAGDDPAEQDAAEPGCGVGRQVEPTERDTPGRRDRP